MTGPSLPPHDPSSHTNLVSVDFTNKNTEATSRMRLKALVAAHAEQVSGILAGIKAKRAQMAKVRWLQSGRVTWGHSVWG